MTIRMADAAESLALAGLAVEAYASYVDGDIGDQPNHAKVTAAYPGKQHLSIALNANHKADCYDIEPGAGLPSLAPDWVKWRQAAGLVRPVVYANISTMTSAILPVLAQAGIGTASVRLWTAHYGLGEHICGPRTCGQLPIDADGTQWTDAYHGPSGVVDMSLLNDDFFGAPAPAVFGPPRGLVAKPGHTNVQLTWASPGDRLPYAVHHYQVTIRYNGQDVATYPRDVPKGANPEVHDFGSLQPGTAYDAFSRAVPESGPAGEWAKATFTTGRA